MSGIPTLSRFIPVSSAYNAPSGIHVEPKLPGQMLSVTYSFMDAAGLYNPLTNPIQSRIAVIAGRFGDNLSAFNLAYDLNPYRVLFEAAINDPGPTPIIIPPDAEDGVAIETDGVTVLLAAPIAGGITGTPLFVSKLQVTSRGLITRTASALRQEAGQSNSQSDANSTSTGSGGGGGTGGGTVSGGGTKTRPLNL